EPGVQHDSVPSTFYLLTGGSANVRVENGGSTRVEYKTGEAGWGEAERHALDNVGTTDIVVVVVDIKGSTSESPPSTSTRAETAATEPSLRAAVARLRAGHPHGA